MQLTCGYILLLIACSVLATEISIDSENELQQSYLCGNQLNSNNNLVLNPNITHYINSESFCLVRNVSNIGIVGEGARVVCNQTNTGFGFMNVMNLTISGIVFYNCGGLVNESLLPLVNTSPHQRAVLTLTLCIDVRLTNITILNHQGYGIIGANMLGNSTLNSITIFNGHQISSSGILIYYTDLNNETQDDIISPSLLISQCLISGNRNLYPLNLMLPGIPFGEAGGLSITILQEHYKVSIAVENTRISGNSGNLAAGVQIVERNGINRAEIQFNNCSFQGNDLPEKASGAGMQILFLFEFDRLYELYMSSNIEPDQPDIVIADSLFQNNTSAENGAAISITSQFQNISAITVLVTDTSFNNNDASGGGDCIIATEQRSVLSKRPKLTLILENVFMSTFPFSVSALANSGSSGAVTVIGLSALIIRGKSCLQNGDNSAVTALTTDVYIFGNATFANNNAVFGGALYLQRNSHLFLSTNANIWFLENCAVDRGGAVYIDPISGNQCAIQFIHENHLIDNNGSINTNLLFENNRARIGSSVYGAPLYNCFALPGSALPLDYQFNSVYRENFRFISSSGNSSFEEEFRSFPTAVCLCNISSPVFQCLNDNDSLSLTIFPGKRFDITISPVDDVWQPVEATVISRLSRGSLGNTGINPAARFISGCTQVNYTIEINETNTTSKLQLNLRNSANVLTINLTINPCTLGFELNEDTGLCECSSFYSSLICDTQTGLIKRLDREWLGIIAMGNETVLALAQQCPLTHCEFREPIDLSASAHTVCEGNRTGVLCGVCREGFSVQFGSSNCAVCSSYYLFTIVVYAAAGVFLIFILFLLKLTISAGTINGFIFYAQLVGANVAIFGTLGQMGSYTHYIYVIIALVNLDLGFPLCFFDGMTLIQSIGLQFVFPAYVWIIMIVLIIITNYSARFQRMLGNNICIDVLVTLIYLSFGKLVRTTTFILAASPISLDNGEYYFVWLFDGSVRFGHGLHGFLLMLAIVFILLTISYQIWLIISQKFGSRGRLALILKPIIDAHSAPFKTKYRFWMAIRLIYIEIFIALTVALTHKTIEVVFVKQIMLILLIAVEAYINPFKCRTHNLLDMYFLLNLALFQATQLLISALSEGLILNSLEDFILTDNIFITAAIIVGVGIVIYHIIFMSGLFKAIKKYYDSRQKKVPIDFEVERKVTTTEIVLNEQRSAIQNEEDRLSSLRESLLDED